MPCSCLQSLNFFVVLFFNIRIRAFIPIQSFFLVRTYVYAVRTSSYVCPYVRPYIHAGVLVYGTVYLHVCVRHSRSSWYRLRSIAAYTYNSFPICPEKSRINLLYLAIFQSENELLRALTNIIESRWDIFFARTYIYYAYIDT